MFDPANLTLGQVSSALRDFTVVGVLLTIAWKSRGLYETVKNFFERLTSFMDIVEADSAFIREGMQTLLHNHLTHIEADLKTLSGRKDEPTSFGE